MKNHGFVAPKEITPDNYVLGSFSLLPKVILQPSRDWRSTAPDFEPQQKRFETYNCTGFNTLSAIENLLARLGINENYSDRWVGIIAGTKAPGNDPHIVAEAIRKHGLIPESMLPFSDDLKNIDEYYSFKGADEAKCREAGKKWLERFDFGHEWVFQGGENKQEKMLEALLYSPLGVSVRAWEKEGALFAKKKGSQDNHWTCNVVGMEEKKYWIIDDSYLDDSQPFKYLKWDYDFSFCKRYSITIKATKEEKTWTILQALQKLFQLLGFIQANPNAKPTDEVVIAPVTPQEPATEPRGSLLLEWARAIELYEGANKAWNNPGAIRSVSGPFLKFPTYQAGFDYLCDYLTRAATGKHKAYRPDMTLLEFQKVYSPTVDHNDPLKYAQFVAKRLGVTTDYQIKNLI